MAVEIVMPAVEMAQDSGILVRWLKAEGEFVKQGEPVMEIETDKTVFEFEAPGSGTLANVSAKEGDEIPVGQVMAVLLAEGESAPKEAAASTKSVATPLAESPASADGAAQAPSQAAQPAVGKMPLASPKARRLAAEAGISLASVRGSGPDGAVLAGDVAQQRGAEAAPPVAEQEYEIIPLKGKRRIIAERMQQSAQAAPHISLSLSVDVGELQRLVERLSSQVESETGAPLKMTPVLAKVTAAALEKHPRLNAHFVDEEIHQYSAIHLGIAVALDDGLIVPVIRDVGGKKLTDIHIEMQDLLSRARSGRLRPEEIKGGTFTISNLGMFGIEQFTSIVNPPEIGILSVGTITDRAVKVNDQIALRPMMQVTVNVDHRAVDGAVAADFLKTLKSLLENPYLLFS